MNYKTGLLVGRFQPFHLGHLHLIQQALEQVEKLVIGIGSANIFDNNNPLDFRTRDKMLNQVFDKEELQNRIIKTLPINDYPDDLVWLENSIKLTGQIDVVIGNNEWVNGIFEAKGYPILRLGLYRRDLYESKKIRQLIKEGKEWEDCVPSYLIEEIKINCQKRLRVRE